MAFLSTCSYLLHLVLQVECADFVVANKTDMLPKQEQLDQLIAIISSLNPLATVMPCQNGKVSAHQGPSAVCALQKHLECGEVAAVSSRRSTG